MSVGGLWQMVCVTWRPQRLGRVGLTTICSGSGSRSVPGFPVPQISALPWEPDVVRIQRCYWKSPANLLHSVKHSNMVSSPTNCATGDCHAHWNAHTKVLVWLRCPLLMDSPETWPDGTGRTWTWLKCWTFIPDMSDDSQRLAPQ